MIVNINGKQYVVSGADEVLDLIKKERKDYKSFEGKLYFDGEVLDLKKVYTVEAITEFIRNTVYCNAEVHPSSQPSVILTGLDGESVKDAVARIKEKLCLNSLKVDFMTLLVNNVIDEVMEALKKVDTSRIQISMKNTYCIEFKRKDDYSFVVIIDKRSGQLLFSKDINTLHAGKTKKLTEQNIYFYTKGL